MYEKKYTMIGVCKMISINASSDAYHRKTVFPGNSGGSPRWAVIMIMLGKYDYVFSPSNMSLDNRP